MANFLIRVLLPILLKLTPDFLSRTTPIAIDRSFLLFAIFSTNLQMVGLRFTASCGVSQQGQVAEFRWQDHPHLALRLRHPIRVKIATIAGPNHLR